MDRTTCRRSEGNGRLKQCYQPTRPNRNLQNISPNNSKITILLKCTWNNLWDRAYGQATKQMSINVKDWNHTKYHLWSQWYEIEDTNKRKFTRIKWEIHQYVEIKQQTPK